MPDELPADGGAPEAPQDTQPEVDFEKRWKDTHAEYNRLNEQFRRFESDEDAVLEFIQEKHPHLLSEEEDPDPDPELFEDDSTGDEETRRTLAELQEWREQVETREQQQDRTDNWTGWEQYVKEQAAEKGVELKARDLKALKMDSIGKDGYPIPPDRAAEVLDGYVSEYFAEPEEPVKKKKAPHVLPGGKAASEQVDWGGMSESEQIDHMVARARALEAQ